MNISNSTDSKIEILSTPIQINKLLVRNRVVMGSMHTGLEEEKDNLEALASFYEERVKGGVGLIITGGVSPNWTGRLTPFGADLSFSWQCKKHRNVTDRVHKHGAKILLQLLHAGRYSFHPFMASASAIKAPISPFKPRAMSLWEVRKTVRQFGRAAKLAKRAGYDGVEVMGSEGYLINQFLSAKTNRRSDQYGGDIQARTRFAKEVVQEIRTQAGPDFVICFRISLMDLVEGGNTKEEVIETAKILEAAGVDIFDSGIGWHEAKVPTIYLEVPRGHFAFATEFLKKAVRVPVMATNRINMPEVANNILTSGVADMVSLARPLLADAEWANKAIANQAQKINTCIACNQACLDHIFVGKRSTCMVNPRACYETELVVTKAKKIKKIAVVGAGPAGLQAATTLAERGHQVTLFEQRNEVGGQLLFAAKIPGKEEFNETVRYFVNRLHDLNVQIKTSRSFTKDDQNDFDEIILSTGVQPRLPKIQTNSTIPILNYQDYLQSGIKVEGPVVVIGGGPIAIDVAEQIIKNTQHIDFNSEWGVDSFGNKPGWLAKASQEVSPVSITLCQRSEARIGSGLGKTSGWAHRDFLKRKKVRLLSGIQYVEITNEGLVIENSGKRETLPAKLILICAGQESVADLVTHLPVGKFHLVGGAKDSSKVDAKRSIREAFELALRI